MCCTNEWGMKHTEGRSPALGQHRLAAHLGESEEVEGTRVPLLPRPSPPRRVETSLCVGDVLAQKAKPVSGQRIENARFCRREKITLSF